MLATRNEDAVVPVHETCHFAFLPLLALRSLTTRIRNVAAISVFEGFPGFLTIASCTCLYLSFRSAAGLKPPIPRRISSQRKDSRLTGGQGISSGRSHTMLATAITSSAVASFFTINSSVARLKREAPSPKIHYERFVSSTRHEGLRRGLAQNVDGRDVRSERRRFSPWKLRRRRLDLWHACGP